MDIGLAEHSYYEGARVMPMPSLKAEDHEIIVDGKEPAEETSSLPYIPILEKQHSGQLSSSCQKRKAPLNNPDSEDDSLEDEDLHFKGFCYTTTGPDGTKSTNDTFACPYCPAFFDSRVGLTNHAKLHGAAKKMKCELCDFACTNKKTMRLHRRIHGIIPVRGRRSTKATQPRETKLDVEKLDLDSPYEKKLQTTTQDDEHMPKGSECNEIPIRRSTRQRLTRLSNSCPTAGAVTFIKTIDEERIIIVPPNHSARQNTNTDQNKKEIVPKSGLDEEEEDVNVDDDEQQTECAKNNDYDDTRLENKHQKERSLHSSKRSQHHYDFICSICPYCTNISSSFDQHMIGHSRPSGYVCSVCNFKHEYKRWLRQHCCLHKGVSFQWPPEYVYGEEGKAAVNVEDDNNKEGKLGATDLEEQQFDTAEC